MNKDLMNEAYDAILITAGVLGVSMLTKKLAGERLTSANSLGDYGRLAAGVTGSTMLVKYAKDKKWLPDDPFKKS